jgi:predicted outer membrane protein
MIHRLTIPQHRHWVADRACALAQMSHPNSVVGPAAATASKDALGQQDANFVKEATAGGMAEIELSKIAEKTENPEVNRFAQRMVHDHTAANTELAGIADGLNVETPKRLTTTIRESVIDYGICTERISTGNTCKSWSRTMTKL